MWPASSPSILIPSERCQKQKFHWTRFSPPIARIITPLNLTNNCKYGRAGLQITVAEDLREAEDEASE